MCVFSLLKSVSIDVLYLEFVALNPNANDVQNRPGVVMWVGAVARGRPIDL